MDPDPSPSTQTIRQTQRIDFDFCVYALGSHLPPPINIWSGPGPLPIQQQSQSDENNFNSHDSSSVLLARKNIINQHPDSPSSDQETDLTTEDSSSQSDDLISSSDFSQKINLKNGNGSSSSGMTSSSSYSSNSSDKELHSNDSTYNSSTSKLIGKDLLPLSPPSSKHPSNGSLRSFANLESKEKEQDPSIVKVQMPLSRGTKKEGMAWLEEARKRIDEASSVLVIGGGALGVREYRVAEGI